MTVVSLGVPSAVKELVASSKDCVSGRSFPAARRYPSPCFHRRIADGDGDDDGSSDSPDASSGFWVMFNGGDVVSGAGAADLLRRVVASLTVQDLGGQSKVAAVSSAVASAVAWLVDTPKPLSSALDRPIVS